MGKRAPHVVALISGGLLALAFPEPSIGPLAWVCLVPLLLLLRDTTARRGFGLGFTFGLGYFGLLLYWISIIGFLGWAVLVMLQATFIGGFAALYATSARWASVWARILLAGTLWVLFEYLREAFPVVGFTWGGLAQSQHSLLWILKVAGLAGGWGVALLVVSVNALIAEALRTLRAGDRRSALIMGAVAVVLLIAPIVIPEAQATGDELEVAIVQGNVPREMDASFAKDLLIIDSHVHLTEELPSTVDLVVWPESSVGIDPFEEPSVGESLATAATAVGKPMIVGGNKERDDGNYEVTAYLVSVTGEIVDSYQKTHLVPFGEYVPARDFLGWLPGLEQVPRDAVAGSEKTLFDIGGNKVAPVLSFEGDFGSLVRGRIDAGGRLLVVATNTSTWGDSWASAQHVALSQVRAAENGVYVVHAALSGVSAIIEPGGRVVEDTDLWEPATVIQEVRFAESITPYARFGDWLPLLCLFVAAGLTYGVRRRPEVTVL